MGGPGDLTEEPALRLAKAHAPVTSLGFGTRAGVWFQGCSIGCPGCMSRDTWSTDAPSVPVEEVSAWCQRVHPDLDGLTISGGEPFQQPEALAALVRSVRRWAGTTTFDVLVYSGLPFEELERDHGDVLDLVDAVIAEPYVAAKPADDGWRGSTNQQYHARSELGRRRAPETWDGRGHLQVSVTAEEIWFVGIPRRGDLHRLEVAARERGVSLGGVSWRP